MEDLKMIDYYRVKCITYVNGKEKSIHSFCSLFTEEQVKRKEIKITWENLDKVYYKWGLVLPFNYFQYEKEKITLRELQNYDVELVNQFLKDKNLDMIRM